MKELGFKWSLGPKATLCSRNKRLVSSDFQILRNVLKSLWFRTSPLCNVNQLANKWLNGLINTDAHVKLGCRRMSTRFETDRGCQFGCADGGRLRIFLNNIITSDYRQHEYLRAEQISETLSDTQTHTHACLFRSKRHIGSGLQPRRWTTSQLMSHMTTPLIEAGRLGV